MKLKLVGYSVRIETEHSFKDVYYRTTSERYAKAKAKKEHPGKKILNAFPAFEEIK